MVANVEIFLGVLTASARACDEFDKLSELLETETALRERAETMAIEVGKH